VYLYSGGEESEGEVVRGGFYACIYSRVYRRGFGIIRVTQVPRLPLLVCKVRHLNEGNESLKNTLKFKLFGGEELYEEGPGESNVVASVGVLVRRCDGELAPES